MRVPSVSEQRLALQVEDHEEAIVELERTAGAQAVLFGRK